MIPSVLKLYYTYVSEGKISEQTLKDINGYFVHIDVCGNLLVNAVMCALFNITLLFSSSFKWETKLFSVYWFIFCLFGNLVFYVNRFGLYRVVWNALKIFIPTSDNILLPWINNFSAMMILSSGAWFLTLSVYFLISGISSFLYQFTHVEWFRYSFYYDIAIYESCYLFTIYFIIVYSLVIFLLVPVWKNTYRELMSIGRGPGKWTHISYTNIGLEILYTSTSFSVFLTEILFMALNHRLKIKVCLLYIVFGFLEFFFFFDHSVQFKFSPLHRIMHNIKYLYNLVHIEHHICKTIYPNTPGFGYFEFWFVGGGPGIVRSSILFPYLRWIYAYLGLNVFSGHCMLSKKFSSWHLFHHVILADIYGLNKPDNHDITYSNDYQKLRGKLTIDRTTEGRLKLRI